MACTRCGQCLESCPTYTLWGAEADSPRGRINLIEQALAPDGVLSEAMIRHVDSCLGCMACMTACPEDVDYPSLLLRARVAINYRGDRPLRDRAARRAALELIPRAGRASRLVGRGGIPRFTAAQGEIRGRVGFLAGCGSRGNRSSANRASVAVLAAEGFEVITPPVPSDCCGALSLHSGHVDDARSHAQATIDAFTAVGGVDHVVTDSGRCGLALKAYGDLLDTGHSRAFSSVVLDVQELLAQLPLRSPLAPLALRVAVHEACQLRHSQKLPDVGRALLEQIPGLELIDLRMEAGACCGAPGIYRLTRPRASADLAARQAHAILATGADLVVSGDGVCAEHLAGHLRRLGRRIDVRHPVELLAQSIGDARDA